MNYALVIGFPEGGGGPRADVGEYAGQEMNYALVIGFPEGGDPGLMWENMGTLWGLCFCSTERGLGTIGCSLVQFQFSIQFLIYCL